MRAPLVLCSLFIAVGFVLTFCCSWFCAHPSLCSLNDFCYSAVDRESMSGTYIMEEMIAFLAKGYGHVRDHVAVELRFYEIARPLHNINLQSRTTRRT